MCRASYDGRVVSPLLPRLLFLPVKKRRNEYPKESRKSGVLDLQSPFRALGSLSFASSYSLVVRGVLRSRWAFERVYQVDDNSQRWKQCDQEEYQRISPRRAGKVLTRNTVAHAVENDDRYDLEDVR